MVRNIRKQAFSAFLLVLAFAVSFASASAASDFANLAEKASHLVSATGNAIKSITGNQVVETGAAIECSDSESGKGYYEKGVVTGAWPGGKFSETETDACCINCDSEPVAVDSSETLGEVYCDNGRIALEIYSCPNGCRDGACLLPDDKPVDERPVEFPYTLKIAKGWNLVSLPPLILSGGEYGSSTCSFLKGDIEGFLSRNAYGYDKLANKYVHLTEGVLKEGLTMPNDGTKRGYLINTIYNSYWLKSPESCEIMFNTNYEAGKIFRVLDSIDRIESYEKVEVNFGKGWNFLAVGEDMMDKRIDDFKGSCLVQKAFAFDPHAKAWQDVLNERFGNDAVGWGIVFKAADDCRFSSDGGPPAIPE